MPGCTNCPSDVATASNTFDPLFRRVLWIALIANAGMFLVEIIASQLGDSISLQADALDFFSDATNYAISLFVLGMALHLRARASLIKGASMAVFIAHWLAARPRPPLCGQSHYSPWRSMLPLRFCSIVIARVIAICGLFGYAAAMMRLVILL